LSKEEKGNSWATYTGHAVGGPAQSLSIHKKLLKGVGEPLTRRKGGRNASILDNVIRKNAREKRKERRKRKKNVGMG